MTALADCSPSRPLRAADVARWDILTDVAVLGFGIAGACAAIEARAAGAAVAVEAVEAVELDAGPSLLEAAW